MGGKRVGPPTEGGGVRDLKEQATESRNPLGVMQGRLLPKYQGRYQAHPLGYWQDEFPIAAELGLHCIEFILDFNDAEKNPLLTPEGHREIRNVSARTGVKVLSICADYFMEAPLHSEDESIANKSGAMLERLLFAVGDLDVTDIVIPCVDQASIQNHSARERFFKRLSATIPQAEQVGVNLSLETDLPPTRFGELLARLDSPQVTVNYDIGNSSSLGYCQKEELNAYGKRISDIHVKDRFRNGGPVKLGTGSANIPEFLRLIERFDYQGPFVMQAYRDDEGVGLFKEQLQWLKTYL